MSNARTINNTYLLFELNIFLTGISLVDSTDDAEEESKSELAVAEGIQYAYAVARSQEENVITEGEQVLHKSHIQMYFPLLFDTMIVFFFILLLILMLFVPFKYWSVTVGESISV